MASETDIFSHRSTDELIHQYLEALMACDRDDRSDPIVTTVLTTHAAWVKQQLAAKDTRLT